MKRLIIFDLDGTLIDTLEDLKNSVNHALFLHNLPLRDIEQIRKAIGNGVAKLVYRSMPSDSIEEHYDSTLEAFKIHYEQHAFDNTKPYDGVFNLLSRLKNDGYLLAVCTNKIQNVAEELINNIYPGLFDIVVGDQEGLRKKPEPDMVNFIINHFSLSKDECIYVGDTEVDKQTAVNSGIDYIIETYGYRTKEEWKVLGNKEKVVDTTEEIYKAIKNWN